MTDCVEHKQSNLMGALEPHCIASISNDGFKTLDVRSDWTY